MRAWIVLAALLAGGCASTPAEPYITPQVTIKGAGIEAAKIPIVSNCVSAGGAVTINTPNQLVCTMPMPATMSAFVFRALVTPKYSTNPNLRARYTFVGPSPDLMIVVDTFADYQNGFGQETVIPIRNPDVARQAQAMLNKIKHDLETAPASAGQAPQPTPAQPAMKWKAEGW